MDGFTLVSKGDGIDPDRYCICDHCGARVETGILNLADHWSKCFGKKEFDYMMSDPERYIDEKKLELNK